jgi:hypothetical protein
MWLSRNDSASSSSSYGAGSRPMSYGSFGDGDGPDEDANTSSHAHRHAPQPASRPLSGRRALPLAAFSPKSQAQDSTAIGLSQAHIPNESDYDRRLVHAPRPPAAAAASAASTSSSSDQVSHADFASVVARCI